MEISSLGWNKSKWFTEESDTPMSGLRSFTEASDFSAYDDKVDEIWEDMKKETSGIIDEFKKADNPEWKSLVSKLEDAVKAGSSGLTSEYLTKLQKVVQG